eukprot:TRINITY_DN24879_c0_g1_i1.p1 TRINITY_DN24879_c0_g1~~TRINITY_DN24879_c0_g1_i1.p1  ORF type:complete len:224 (+),score=85.36 TRINITY_DN24879_c0_g1_i1:211-882(+)
MGANCSQDCACDSESKPATVIQAASKQDGYTGPSTTAAEEMKAAKPDAEPEAKQEKKAEGKETRFEVPKEEAKEPEVKAPEPTPEPATAPPAEKASVAEAKKEPEAEPAKPAEQIPPLVPPLELVFELQDGSRKIISFPSGPLGFDFEKKVPIVTKRIKAGGQAEALGVQAGWTLKLVGDEDVNSYAQFKPLYDMLKEKQSKLPRYEMLPATQAADAGAGPSD